MVQEQRVALGKAARMLKVLQREKRSSQVVISGLLQQLGGHAFVKEEHLAEIVGTSVRTTAHEEGHIELELYHPEEGEPGDDA